MENHKYEAVFLGVLLLGLASFIGYMFIGWADNPQTQMAYSTDLQKLKNDFNADKGKVRLVLLLSPT